MAFITGERVHETTTTTGTGNVTLLGAESNTKQTFSAVAANNDTFQYAIVHRTAGEWETGIGTFVSATPAVARTIVFESSNADVLVPFSAGIKDVFLTFTAEQALQMEERGVPAPAAPNWITQYAFDNAAEAQVRTRGEYGLIDVLSNRDLFRTRKQFYIGGLGSDTSAADDSLQWGIQIVAHEGVWTNVAGDVDGQRKNMPTAATLDADAGLVGGFTQTRRDFNPDITMIFKPVSALVRRVWAGWMESDHMALDTSAAIHKFAVRLSTSAANVNYCIIHSDGTTETITQIATADALKHSLRLIADDLNARWGYSFDGAVVTWVTTNIPAATALVGLQLEIRTLEAVAKNMDFWWAHGSMEK